MSDRLNRYYRKKLEQFANLKQRVEENGRVHSVKRIRSKFLKAIFSTCCEVTV